MIEDSAQIYWGKFQQKVSVDASDPARQSPHIIVVIERLIGTLWVEAFLTLNIVF